MKKEVLILFLGILLLSQISALSLGEIREQPSANFHLASDISVKYTMYVFVDNNISPAEWMSSGGYSRFIKNSGCSECIYANSIIKISTFSENGISVDSPEFSVPSDFEGKTAILTYFEGNFEWNVGEPDSLIQYYPKEAGDCSHLDIEEKKATCFKSLAEQGADPQEVCSKESISDNYLAGVHADYSKNFRDVCFSKFSYVLSSSEICEHIEGKDARDNCYYLQGEHNSSYYFS